MRGRIVLFVFLAVVAALVGVYVGRSTNTPTAVGEPETATPADSSVGSTQRWGSGSGPSRAPTASSRTAGSPNTDANRDHNRTQPGQRPPTKPPSPPLSTDPVRFGKVTTTPSDNTVLTDLAESDRRAFTLGLSDREIHVDPGSTRDATRSFALTLPLTDGAKGETLWIHVLGYAFTEEGTSARMTLRLNGQVRVTDFPANWDKEFQQTLRVPATPTATYRLSGVIEVHQNPDTAGTAILQVSSIETRIG